MVISNVRPICVQREYSDSNEQRCWRISKWGMSGVMAEDEPQGSRYMINVFHHLKTYQSRKSRAVFGSNPKEYNAHHVGVDDSSDYWLGSVAVNAPLLDLGSSGFEPRPGLSFLFLHTSQPDEKGSDVEDSRNISSKRLMDTRDVPGIVYNQS
jgi:hypothetical protein